MRRDGLSGGLLAYDGQLIDDARLVTAVARTAAQHGARILTRVGASTRDGHVGDVDRRAFRRVVRRRRRARSSMPPVCGRATSTRRCGYGPVAEHIWCSTPRRSAIPLPR